VNSGGVLSGVGTLHGATVVKSGGTLAPGDDPGTLTTTAAVTLNAGSASIFDIDGTGTGTGAGNYSRVIVNGATFTAAGTLEPLLRGITGSATNTYTPAAGTAFQIVNATGGVLGSYATLVQPAGLAAGTEFAVDYGATTITLAVTPASYANLSAFGVALTSNQTAIAAALDASRPAAGSTAANALYGPLYAAPLASDPALLSQLDPSIYGDDLLAIRDGFGLQSSAIETQLDSRRDGSAGVQSATLPGGATIWVSGLGQFLNVTSSKAPGFDGSLGGVAAGVDAPAAPGLRAGAALGYLHQDISAKNSSSISGGTLQVTVYGSLTQGNLFADGQVGLFGLQGSAKRNETAYGTDATANFSGYGAGGTLRAGALLSLGGISVEPSAGITGLSLHNNGATEGTGGGAALNVDAGSLGSLQSLLSVRAGQSFGQITPSVSVGWSHEFLDTSIPTTARFTATGTGFTVDSPAIGRDAAVVGVRAAFAASPSLNLFAGYDGAFSSHGSTNSVNGGLQYSF
jgi:uncharacterized protein with beta-barrel porin domain